MFDPDFCLSQFSASLQTEDVINDLRRGLIGENILLPGPFGERPLIYADYVASGRSLQQVETFIMTNVLPYYANSHTQASFCGRMMTRLRAASRREVARLCRADEHYSTVFTGSGATSGINRLVHLLGVTEMVRAGKPPLIVIGPYEHHSNILPWRESGADIVEIGEAKKGGPDLQELEDVLSAAGQDRLKIGAFSAASNVTGIITDVDAVSKILNRHHARVVWDYAGGGPYLDIDMRSGTEAQKDAIVISPHKFIGGPGASGILIVRDQAVSNDLPSAPGGGTVRFVSPWGHDYSHHISDREEAGTPNVVGDIRAGLAFLVKEVIGQPFMDARHAELRRMAEEVWRKNDNIELIGQTDGKNCLPIFSMRIRDDAKGGYIHQQLFTRLLSDCYGIQARGGCACAGPYAHRLLDIDAAQSSALRQAILNGDEIEKPGWTRLNLSVLMDDAKAMKVISAVDELASSPYPMADIYDCDIGTARFEVHRAA
ncbi:aminotransferase class V-fold PLP-dependent enzyme [Kozakia baliensis]|uniref:Aminotransferase class V n=1 Tax=Kozakia baliensis TaxID=153496 RepID=A0A1D8UW26_9PROT|nr:aminotransferase class V-fold PLP-dependent enzyme [Kozakia baliensis]AOX17844.1 aminotransferase class V [Kozakia baliensis]GBR33487.1 NifS-like protein [Kozakia baliensis NRIC 0488]GEL64938.1 aminotransferase class V [Kozakia baliensis]